VPCDEPSPMAAARVACVQNEWGGVLEESDEKRDASWVGEDEAGGGSRAHLYGLRNTPR